uniref:Uncharacterized protein n=1 Tax=Arundo donax TaxID=35708 RepID=A0A0A9ELX9_ARUDO
MAFQFQGLTRKRCRNQQSFY